MRGIVIAFPGKWAGARIKARVDRIALLLAELEKLPLPFVEGRAVLTQARETFRTVEERLASYSCSAPATAAQDGDSQPHADREVLERHFHALHR